MRIYHNYAVKTVYYSHKCKDFYGIVTSDTLHILSYAEKKDGKIVKLLDKETRTEHNYNAYYINDYEDDITENTINSVDLVNLIGMI